MQRARRLASTAVIAALAVAGLGACRAEPGVAAYVGNDRITEERVNAVYDDARAKLDGAVEQLRRQQGADPSASQQPVPETVDMPIKRTDVVTTLVGRDVLKALAAERKVQATPLSPDELVQSIGLPADTLYAAAFGEFRGYLDALAQTVKPAQVTEADLRDVFNRLSRAGGLPPGATFQSFSADLGPEDRQTLAQNIGLRNELFTHVQKLDATINPRYGTAELALVSFRSQQGQPVPLVVLPFDAASGETGPVRDVS